MTQSNFVRVGGLPAEGSPAANSFAGNKQILRSNRLSLMRMGFRIVYPYAAASITPRDSKVLDPYLPDGSGFLLRKEKGRWKVLKMGTSFHGVDKEFGISADKWKRLELR